MILDAPSNCFLPLCLGASLFGYDFYYLLVRALRISRFQKKQRYIARAAIAPSTALHAYLAPRHDVTIIPQDEDH